MKKKTLKNIVAALIIIGSIVTLGLKFWADDQALDVDRPKVIVNSPVHTLSFLIGNTIYVINEHGLTDRVIDLDSRGINAIGGFAYFGNGDILIYNEDVEPTILETVARYLRIKESRHSPPVGKAGLYRCDADIKNCRIFSTALPAFYSTFRVVIDPATDDVYLADTPRFTLYKLSGSGELLARSTEGWLFPNQILLYENNLYVANTNKHSIREVQTDTESFGDEIENHDAIISGEHRWPAELVKVHEQWWVGVYGGNMDQGRIQIFDNSWNKVTEPLLDEEADASSMALFDDTVFVGDWSNIKIYRFDLSGQRLPELNNTEIDEVFSRSLTSMKDYEKDSFYALLAFIIVIVSGVAAAFVLEKEETLAYLKSDDESCPETAEEGDLERPPGGDVYWIGSRHRAKLRWYGYAVWGSFAIYGLLIAWVMSGLKGFSFELLLMLSLYYPVMGSAFWFWNRVCRYRIGVSGELLLIDDGRGKVVAGKGSAIKYHKTLMFVIDDVVVLLGQPRSRIFPEQDLKKWVIPRMHRGESIGIWAMNKIMWKQRHPGIVLVLTYVLIAAVLLIVKYF